ncbi:MAG: PEP-CTERM sorting domain-containing protein [Planctomycetota bacterium]|nr:PEP-CTERM sorting domain-containing protein [Planctomycetota bacterium]
MISVRGVARSAVRRRASRRRYAGLLGWALVLAVVLGILAPAAQAAPFLTTYMEARVAGGSWGTVVAVVPGQTVEYRIMGMISPVGTANVNVGSGYAGQILSLHKEGWFTLVPAAGDITVSGVQGMKFNAYQTATDPLQVDFATATLASGTFSDGKAWSFGAGTGASGGGPVARTGGTGNNLIGIRPITRPGYYIGVPSLDSPAPFLIASGSMGTSSGPVTHTDSKVLMDGVAPNPNPDAVTTTMRVWTGTSATDNTPKNKPVNEWSTWTSDPATVYNGITLYTPWAEAAINNVPPGPIDVTLGTELALNGTVSFSSHTTATYNWIIDGGLPIPTLTPDLALTNADLMALLGSLPQRTINLTLNMTTGDGQSASSGADIVLTPEPATLGLLALGLSALIARRRR